MKTGELDSINIRDELEAYDRLPASGQRVVGRRLIRHAIEMTHQIDQLAAWLVRGDDILNDEYNKQREEKWLAKLDELRHLEDMRNAIREKVLDG